VDNVFSGYYKDPVATRAAFDDEGWLRTGDLGEWTERGFLRFKGRKKEILVTSGGKNISPSAIEARFAGRPFVEHVVVYGDDHRYLVALVTLDEDQTLTFAEEHGLAGSFAELTRHPRIHELVQQQINAVNRELPPYQTIKRFHLHDGHLSAEAGQLTQTLKLRRAEVWRRFHDQLETLYQEGQLPLDDRPAPRPRL
jgi:long-chain acyl-CoA synthetase